MFQVTTYLLACSMGVVIVMGQQPPALPPFVNGFKYQCQARGPYVGACSTENIMRSGFRCDKLTCAKMISPDVYEGVEQGLVLDGTKCAADKVCSQGKCVFVGKANIPPQIGPGPQYLCQSRTGRVVPTAVVLPQVRITTPRTSEQSRRRVPTTAVTRQRRNTTPRRNN